MKKNEIHLGLVTAYGSEGEGIIKFEGYTVFLPFAIPGERVRFKVLKVQKNLVFAKIEEVLAPAEERVRPKCEVFQKCGGCQLMHVNYNSQLVFKRELLQNCFKKIAHINLQPLKTASSSPELYYRNKLQLPIRQTESGVKIGFFAINSHRVVEIKDCLIHGEWCKSVISALKKYISDKKITAYNELTHQGLLRHIVVKKVGYKYLITLVINGKNISNLDYFIKLLTADLGDFTLYLNVNERCDNVILTDEFIHVHGDKFLTDTFLGVKYEIGPASFMQVNDSVKAKLYSKAVELVGEQNTVIDAYCGAGLLSALFAKKANKVIGVEIVQEAISCAKKMAKENCINNIEFICAPCEKVLPEIIKNNEDSVLVLDPPRKGLDKNLLQSVLLAKPKRILYISCSPQTLARDVAVLTGTLKYEGNELIKNVEEKVEYNLGDTLPTGYAIEYLRGYDMFAQCKGVESICLLTKKD